MDRLKRSTRRVLGTSLLHPSLDIRNVLISPRLGRRYDATKALRTSLTRYSRAIRKQTGLRGAALHARVAQGVATHQRSLRRRVVRKAVKSVITKAQALKQAWVTRRRKYGRSGGRGGRRGRRR